jgi:hypothetical protein
MGINGLECYIPAMTKKRRRARKGVISPATAAVAPKGGALRVTGRVSKHETPSGGHKWIVDTGNSVVTSNTSSSSVTIISEIGKKFAPALKRLAKE